MARPKSKAPRNNIASVRLTAAERHEMERRAAHLGITSLSEYVRYLDRESIRAEQARLPYDANSAPSLRRFHSTKHGVIYQGDSLKYLHASENTGSVDLIVTSPPFGLVRKKSYGNEDADDYCEWFRPFADGFRKVLKSTGSLVIDIGGAWKSGTPTRSLYHFELLIMLCREYGFHLCQEHYWWNPSKLPTPAEWVNVRRVRVKDAVNCIWWLSPTPWPKASNRRVLAPYSDSMINLLQNGYTAKLRPSGHDISDKFQRNNGGAVPPNLLAIANTESTGTYQEYCRSQGLDIHPARFPAQLPEYFIRFLTDEGDMVLDPFGGSCVSGMVAEKLGRRWTCVEMSEQYLKGALARFASAPSTPSNDRVVRYTIHSPCTLQNAAPYTPLKSDGGKNRPKTEHQVTRRDKASKLISRHVKAYVDP